MLGMDPEDKEIPEAEINRARLEVMRDEILALLEELTQSEKQAKTYTFMILTFIKEAGLRQIL